MEKDRFEYCCILIWASNIVAHMECQSNGKTLQFGRLKRERFGTKPVLRFSGISFNRGRKTVTGIRVSVLRIALTYATERDVRNETGTTLFRQFPFNKRP